MQANTVAVDGIAEIKGSGRLTVVSGWELSGDNRLVVTGPVESNGALIMGADFILEAKGEFTHDAALTSSGTVTLLNSTFTASGTTSFTFAGVNMFQGTKFALSGATTFVSSNMQQLGGSFTTSLDLTIRNTASQFTDTTLTNEGNMLIDSSMITGSGSSCTNLGTLTVADTTMTCDVFDNRGTFAIDAASTLNCVTFTDPSPTMLRGTVDCTDVTINKATVLGSVKGSSLLATGGPVTLSGAVESNSVVMRDVEVIVTDTATFQSDTVTIEATASVEITSGGQKNSASFFNSGNLTVDATQGLQLNGDFTQTSTGHLRILVQNGTLASQIQVNGA